MGKYQGTTAHRFLQLPDATLGIYNDWDTYCTAALVGPLLNALKSNNQLDYYLSDVEPLQYAAIDMTVRGIGVDKDAKTTYRRKVRSQLTNVDNFIRRCADQAGFRYTEKFPNSKPQTAKLLYEHLGLQVRKTTPKGGWSVDQDALTRLLRNLRKRDTQHRDLIHGFFHRSRLFTIDTRYLNFDIDEDGRLRPTVKMMATKTLRYAYDNPPLQQFPEEARHIFVAASGKVFIVADYSQLEARILGLLARDLVTLQAFADGIDVHSQNARDLFGWSLAHWDDMDPVRRAAARGFAKAFLYRLSYGGTIAAGDKKLVCPCERWGCAEKNPPVMDIKKTEAAAVERRWYQRHPAVITFHRAVEQEIRRTHGYRPPLGGFRWIAQPWGADLAREAKNIPIQTTAAQVMNRAQVGLYKAGIPLVMQWHDAAIAEVPEDEAPMVASSIRAIMEAPVPEIEDPLTGKPAVFPVDIAVGRNLGKWSSSNPEGLKEAA